MDEVKYKKDFKDKFITMMYLHRGKNYLFITRNKITAFYDKSSRRFRLDKSKCVVCGDNRNLNYLGHFVRDIKVYYYICNKPECFTSQLCGKCFCFTPHACANTKQKITLWLILRSQNFPKDIIKLIVQKMK